MTKEFEASKLQLETASITVQTLTFKNKQMSLALFRQIPEWKSKGTSYIGYSVPKNWQEMSPSDFTEATEELYKEHIDSLEEDCSTILALYISSSEFLCLYNEALVLGHIGYFWKEAPGGTDRQPIYHLLVQYKDKLYRQRVGKNVGTIHYGHKYLNKYGNFYDRNDKLINFDDNSHLLFIAEIARFFRHHFADGVTLQRKQQYLLSELDSLSPELRDRLEKFRQRVCREDFDYDAEKIAYENIRDSMRSAFDSGFLLVDKINQERSKALKSRFQKMIDALDLESKQLFISV